MKKKFGPLDNKTEALVLSIDSKKDNANCPITTLTEAYRQEGTPYKQFVPHGILQTKIPTIYRNIPKAENKLIGNHTAIVIKGISAESFTEWNTVQQKGSMTILKKI
eukprot:6869896-Ditylum_brightwellii.AAC.1